MGILQQAKSGMVGVQAQKAWDEGRGYFAPTLNAPLASAVASASGNDWPAMLDAITAVGWVLHTWAVTTDLRGLPQPVPLFVRPAS